MMSASIMSMIPSYVLPSRHLYSMVGSATTPTARCTLPLRYTGNTLQLSFLHVHSSGFVHLLLLHLTARKRVDSRLVLDERLDAINIPG